MSRIGLERSALHHDVCNGCAFFSAANLKFLPVSPRVREAAMRESDVRQLRVVCGLIQLRDLARKRCWQKFPPLKTPCGLPVPFDSSVFASVTTPLEEATTLILQNGA